MPPASPFPTAEEPNFTFLSSPTVGSSVELPDSGGKLRTTITR